MPEIVGEVSLTLDGKKVIAEVCRGNFLILPGQNPDIQGPSLSEEDYNRVLENYPQYQAQLERRRDEAKGKSPTAGVAFSLPGAEDAESSDAAEAYDEGDTEPVPLVRQPNRINSRDHSKPDVPKASEDAKRNEITRPALKRVIAVILVFVILGGAAAFFMLNPQLVTGLLGEKKEEPTYMVAVLTSTIDSGQTLREGDLGAREITSEEYARLQSATYVQTDAATGQTQTISPTPVLYEDRSLIVGLFLTKNYPAGTVLTDRMITNQQVVADQYYADIEMADGSTTQIPLQANTGKGMTEVEIVAVIRNEAGEEIQVPLTTLVLEEKTLLDILDGKGGSILDRVGSGTSGGES